MQNGNGRQLNMKIYIAAHKQFQAPADSTYIPLQVGAENKESLGFQGDNTGDNISLKNPNYCELTGLYWIWKNSDADIVGLVHYRRFFYNSIFSDHIMSENEINQALAKADVIVAQRGYTWKCKVKDNYKQMHTPSDLDLVTEVISYKYPDYLPSYKHVMNGHHYSQFNMMICKKSIFDQYCEWLFDVLGYVENHLIVPLEERTQYEKRVFGFLSERLLIVWLLNNSQYHVIEKPVYNSESSIGLQRMTALMKSGMMVVRK